MRPCAFPGCERPAWANGLCQGHLSQLRRGQPLHVLIGRHARSTALETRLLASIEPDTTQWGCWLWTGALTSAGYGLLTISGEQRLAHREAFTLWVGDLTPDKPQACHHCDMRACIRPDHLFAGTQGDNLRDMYRKGRRIAGLTWVRQPALNPDLTPTPTPV